MVHRRWNALAVVVASFLLTVVTAPPAGTTTGFFEYTEPGPVHTIRDFTANGCHTYLRASGRVWNNTSAPAELYAADNCSGIPLRKLNTGQHAQATFGSVYFRGRPQPGYFRYREAGNKKSLRNPRSNTCITLQSDGFVYNATNKTVEIWTGEEACQGTADHFLRKQEHADALSFESVQFIR
ncbi:hypothetical protein A6A06_37100 [Streptomyces sp. CB02923]|uniref:hypothetical protein n=1 Tax=Streptomyces sp. CB02923 TaxID=1718985 RepID=UPI00093D972F|nr:hypothetical protein [Streptomyces sp. CB02923]OKI06272.1 hypothetical protein A6A06_37100 [Streptomyces sp. CB02923]